MENKIGMKWDKIEGMVKVKWIERNEIGEVKEVKDDYIEVKGDGKNLVNIDEWIEKMRKKGKDMRES